MRILVIQLTRMGDIAQSCAFLKALKESYPDSQIDILCDERNKELCENIQVISNVFTLGVGRLRLTEDWVELIRSLEKVKNQGYDIVYNLNSSNISAIISKYLIPENTNVKGHTYDTIKNKVISNPWWTLIKSFLINRKTSPINIVEAFRYTLLDGKEIDYPTFPLRGKKESGVKKGSLGIVIGAGSPKRYYPVPYFSELISLLIAHGYGPIYLLGGTRDIPSASVIEKKVVSASLVNLVGKTTPSELIGILPQLDLVMGSDTGPLHLSASLGTKTLGFYFGPAWFSETGPFGDSSWVIQDVSDCAPCGEERACRRPECRLSITPQLVFSTIKALLENEKLSADEAGKCLILKSKRESGSFTYEVLNNNQAFAFKEIFYYIRLYRDIIAHTFNIPINSSVKELTKRDIYELTRFANCLQFNQLPYAYSKSFTPFVRWLSNTVNGNSIYFNKLCEAIYSTLGELDA